MKKLITYCLILVFAPLFLHSQIINTVAGDGANGYFGDGGLATAAELSYPTQIVLDPTGNYFIADYSNNVIRKVNVSSGIITTIAGNHIQGYSGNGGAATSAELHWPSAVGLDNAGNIYISDALNNCIRKVDASSGIITTISGNTVAGASGDGGPASNAEIDNAYGMAVNPAGDIYLADFGNNKIRKITATSGIINTYAGTGTAGSGGDGGQATNAGLNGPIGVYLDGAGNCYIADYSNHKIRMVTASTGIITTAAGNGVGGYSGDNGPATSAELTYPTSTVVEGTGNIIIGDAGNYLVRKVDAISGNITTIAGRNYSGYSGDGGPATAAVFSRPYGVALDAAGDLFICDEDNNRIRAIGITTGIINSLAGNTVVSIFPNPATDGFTIQFQSSEKAQLIEMYSVTGEKVYEQTLNTSENSIFVSCPQLSAGLYLIKIQLTSGSSVVKKVTIEK